VPGKEPAALSFYDEGLRFECTRCSRCCRHEPGYVFLSAVDLQRLAQYLQMTENEVVDRYCRIVDVLGVRRISLREHDNYDCIFWAPGKECTVYEGRPLQCRAFPFWPANLGRLSDWQQAARRCPGIGRGALHSRRTIEKWLRRREQEPFLNPPAGQGGRGDGAP
jgi:uncharacterized protein